MTVIHRTVGDHGDYARIRVLQLTDANDNPVTAGQVTLRAGGLFELPMTHTSAGDWYADPGPDDLDRSGRFPLEVRVDGSRVTIPGRTPWTLIVRDTVEDPA